MTSISASRAIGHHLLTRADWEALDDEAYRFAELVEGVLVVTPPPSFRHQDVVWKIETALRRAVPADWIALHDVEVVVDEKYPATYRVPDVVVAPRSALDRQGGVRPAELALVVEVVSPGSRRTDLVTKAAEFAEGGMPLYVVVDLVDDRRRVVVHRLDGERYEVAADAAAVDVPLPGGASIRLDADELLA